jgi:hypothetical protein
LSCEPVTRPASKCLAAGCIRSGDSGEDRNRSRDPAVLQGGIVLVRRKLGHIEVALGLREALASLSGPASLGPAAFHRHQDSPNSCRVGIPARSMASALTSSTTGGRRVRRDESSSSLTPGVISGPALDAFGQMLDFASPFGVVSIDAGWADYEHIDVALVVTVSPSRAAKEGSVYRVSVPVAEDLAQTPDELVARTGHLPHSRRKKMIVVEAIEESAARLPSFDQSLIDQTIENMLYAGIGSPRSPRQLTAAAQRGRTGQSDQYVRVDTRGQSGKGPGHVHSELIIGHMA